jgi:Abnormal spindle-like microcephaly-assoc'd, ASPM-SPD-2-Hydin
MLTKAQLILLLSLSAAALVSAQTVAPSVHRDINHDISAPLRELARRTAPYSRTAAAEAGEARENAAFKNQPDDSQQVPVFATLPAAPSSTAAVGVNMLLNFDGLTDTNFWSVPDNDGAVGDTQYVQWVNVQYAVYDKTTGRKILGPLAGTTLWSGFGGTCQTANSGDPIVQFDKIAHRWVLTQHAAPSGGPYYDCVAVSTTSDATGSYYRYAFQLTSFYPDYPKLGVWPDAYYLTIDQLNPAQGYIQVGAIACALERAAMLTGSAAQSICFTTSGAVYHSLLPADMDGTIAPPAGSPNYMLNLGTNALNLWQFHVDFQTPADSTFTGPASLPVNAFVRACNGRVCVPQVGTTQTLDSIADRLMWRLAYRHFADGHESLVTNHTIGSTNSGVRWYEIQDPGANPTIVQQGVIDPDASYRWMGSVAMDQSGDIAVGYSESSASTAPAIYINGRQASDPLNTMEGETLIFAGAGSQNGSNRWGDYTSMTVDPTDDCTFWYTNEYLAASGSFNWNTRIASFKFPGCSSAQPSVTLSPSTLVFGNQPLGTTSAGQTITVNNNQDVALAVSDVATSGDYSETDNCQPSVPANGKCTVVVKFSPTAAGTRTGQLTLTDDADNTPQIASLTGTGTAPTVNLSTNHLFFGVHAVNSTSSVQSVTITNKGQAPLLVSAIGASGDYLERDTCAGNSIPAGSTCSVSVQFAPGVLGLNNGWITLNDNAPGSPHLIEATGAGDPPLTLSPPTFAFGTVAVGDTSTPQTLTLTNYLTTTINFSYSASGSYSVVAGGVNPCGTSLSGGTQCTLQVKFSPTTSGVLNGAISVVHNAANSPQSVGLFATGSGGSAPPLSFQSTTLLFGSVLLGTSSAPKTMLVTNVSGAPIVFSSITASADFSVSGCTGTLAAGKQCKATITFTPSVGAAISGALTFRDNAAISPQSIYLNGTGLLPVMLSPTSLTFAAQTVGSTSAPQIVTLTNYQFVNALTIDNISASGNYSAVAGGSNPCGSSVAARGSCTISVTFSPAAKGTIGGAVTITHSAGTSPQIVELTGTGR